MSDKEHVVKLDVYYDEAYGDGEKFVACDQKVRIGVGDDPGEAVDHYWNQYGSESEVSGE